MIRDMMLLIIVGAAVVTIIPRVAPLVLLSRITLPERAVRWLGFVPTAVLAALLAQTVFLPDGQIAWPPENLAMIAVIPVLAIAVHTHSLIGTVLGGVAVMALLRWILA